MTAALAFIVGAVLGAAVGLFAAGLVHAARRGDDLAEARRRDKLRRDGGVSDGRFLWALTVCLLAVVVVLAVTS